MLNLVMITKDKLIEHLVTLDIDMSEVDVALEIAVEAHKGQVRDSGRDYLEEHVYPLAVSVIKRYRDSKSLSLMISTALLHDVLEDSSVTAKELREKVSNAVVVIVESLSKTKEEGSRQLSEVQKLAMNKRYLNRLKEAGQESIILKLEDRLQNLSCISEQSIPKNPTKYQRYILGTKTLFLPLVESLESTVNYERLLSEEIDRVSKLLQDYEEVSA